MKFSVCIPIYNAELFVRRCLSSILVQSYNKYDIYLVDDGSHDASSDICMQYAMTYSSISITSQYNNGPSSARNTAIDVSLGEYVLFVDADDSVLSNYFLSLKDSLDENQADMIWFGSVYDNGKRKHEKKSPFSTIFGRRDILDFLEYQFCKHIDGKKIMPYSCNCDTHSCCNKAISRKVLGNIRFPQGTVVEEDLRFNLKLIESVNSIVIIPNILYCYQQQCSGSVTTKYNPEKFESKLKAYREEILFSKRSGRMNIKNFFENSMISYVSSCVNNLCYNVCPLTLKQKIQQIRIFFQTAEVLNAVHNCQPLSMRTKVMAYLIQHNLVLTCWIIHRIGKLVR